MRMRSPRIAPPVNGLVGSTATTPSVFPRPRMCAISRSTSVLFPAPGLPVIPMSWARPVLGNKARSSGSAAGWISSMRRMRRAAARTSPCSTPAAPEPDAERPDGDPSLAEDAERSDEPVVDLADAVLVGHQDVLEDELGGVAGAHSQLSVQWPLREALHPALEDEGADPLLPLLRAGHRQDDEHVAHRTLRDEHLRAVPPPSRSPA